MDTIPTTEIKYKKKVGSLDGDDIFEIGLVGGLNMIVSCHDRKTLTLGVGSHRGIARHIAKKLKPAIKFTDLLKADYIDPAHFAHLLPEYEDMTARFRTLEGKQ